METGMNELSRDSQRQYESEPMSPQTQSRRYTVAIRAEYFSRNVTDSSWRHVTCFTNGVIYRSQRYTLCRVILLTRMTGYLTPISLHE